MEPCSARCGLSAGGFHGRSTRSGSPTRSPKPTIGRTGRTSRHSERCLSNQSYPRSQKPSESDKGSNDDQLRRPIRQSRALTRLINVRSTTLNENGETIQVFVVNLIGPRRDRSEFLSTARRSRQATPIAFNNRRYHRPTDFAFTLVASVYRIRLKRSSSWGSCALPCAGRTPFTYWRF